MKLNKNKFNELLRVTRKYWDLNDTDYLDKIMNIAKDLEKETKLSMVIYINIVDVIARLKVDQDRAYQILNLLGFELE